MTMIVDYFHGELYLKIQRLHKMCSYFGWNTKRKGSISPSYFDRQLPNFSAREEQIAGRDM